MKKVLSLILAALLVLTSVAALAEAVPSKTTSDITVVNEVVTESGAKVEIAIVEPTDEVVTALTAVIEAVINGTKTVAEVYTTDTQDAIAAKLPEGAKVEDLELNEVVAISAPAYKAEDGSATATFTFATAYTPAQTLVAVVTTYKAGVAEEDVVDAEANADGSVTVAFTADVMAKVAAADATTLAILNTK